MPSSSPRSNPALIAGVPASNMALYRRIRFSVGDPAAIIDWPHGHTPGSTLIIRAIEIARAKQHARADHILSPEDVVPADQRSGDRETATAQAVAECIRREGFTRIDAHGSLPLIYAHYLGEAGIEAMYDSTLGAHEQRSKDEEELASLREAQAVTEEAVRMACELVANADADAGSGGVLMHEGSPLTSERVRTIIDIFLLERGYSNPAAIVAGGPQGADCHDIGAGPLRTGEPVIIDIFPRSKHTLYNGDCTRTVVHGEILPELRKMHAAIAEAKSAAIAGVKPGVTGEQIHAIVARVMEQHDCAMGLPPEGAPSDHCAMVHGTGHGVGLEVHEPPLLDAGGPELVAGDVLTIEPGLYCKAIGGMRIEDMVAVTHTGCENFNTLPEGLDWTGR